MGGLAVLAWRATQSDAAGQGNNEGATPAYEACAAPTGSAAERSPPDLMNASRSALITSACVVHMPCGNFG